MKHLFIVNPVCGKGISIERCTNGIVETMTELGIDNYEIYTTKAPRDGYEYAKKEVEKGEHIRVYACGGDGTLYDPMCGSGTLLIEGALYAHNIAPGLNRHFAAERFDVLPKNIWKEEKERAISLEKVDTDFVGYGSDIDAEAIKIAIENASRLPIGKKLNFEKRD